MYNPQKLSTSEFRKSLHKGLGRAYYHIKEYGLGKFQNELDKVCLKDLGYDPQIEGSRAPWLFKLISISDQIEHYCKLVEENLPNADDDYDAIQLADLAAQLALAGQTNMIGVLEKNYRQSLDKFPLSNAYAPYIIDANGEAGFEFVLKTIACRKESEYWREENVYEHAKELFGQERVVQIMNSLAPKYPWISGFQKHLEESAKTIREKYKRISLEAILERIKTHPNNSWHLCRNFGQSATNEELAYIFELFLEEKRQYYMACYLDCFSERELPRINSKVLSLAKHKNSNLRDSAIFALSNNQNRKIRTLALQLLDNSRNSNTLEAISLLNSNYLPGDNISIICELRKIKSSEYSHDAGRRIEKLCKAIDNPELSNCLLWTYENTPCSHCRFNSLKILAKWQTVPQEVAYECLHDSCEDTTELAKAYISK